MIQNNFSYSNKMVIIKKLKSLHICFTIHLKKLSSTVADLDADIYPEA